MECYQQQDSSSPSISRNLKDICNWNIKGLVILLLFFLFAFTLLIIIKGPSASSSSDYGLLSRFIDGQPPIPALSKTNISITEDFINITQKNYTYDKLLGETNISKAEDYINITQKNYTYDKLLGETNISIAEDFINITQKNYTYDKLLGKTNISIAEDCINGTHNNYTYDKLLGGLLPKGFKESSCLSRYQWNIYRKTPPDGGRKPSPYLISKLRDYELLHKKCGPNTSPYKAAVGILRRNKKKTGGGDDGQEYPACKYIIWNPPPGLGNRMLSLVSAFLYALLTNRVLLLRQERGSDMSDLFCEPFPASSWLLPRHFSYGGYKIFNPSFPYRFGNMIKTHSLGKNVPTIVYINLNNGYEENDMCFFCEVYQTHLQKVNWLMVASNQYFAPSLFLIPSFLQELDKLFPEKQTLFHHLGRYLFHPTNTVWGLITRYYEGYIKESDEKLGIQIRVFHDIGESGPPFKHILDQILGCTQKENLLPKLYDDDNNNNNNNKENHDIVKKLSVLVTSLRSGYYEELRNMYWQNATISGEIVAFYQPSHEEVQNSGNQMHDMKALAEIYLLSLTDKLVISGRSTFGYVAYSLGGLQPWILQPPKGTTFCKHSLSMEPCFHFPPTNLVCGNNSSKTLTYIKHCEDASTGVKLFDILH